MWPNRYNTLWLIVHYTKIRSQNRKRQFTYTGFRWTE